MAQKRLRTPALECIPVSLVQLAVWASGPVWTGTENRAPPKFRSPSLPSRNVSLYRLHYSGNWHVHYIISKNAPVR